MAYCQAFGCTNKRGRAMRPGEFISYFCFPNPEKDKERAARWLYNIGTGFTINTFDFTKMKTVCSDHFHENCFEVDHTAAGLGYYHHTPNKRTLKIGAVPTIFSYNTFDVINMNGEEEAVNYCQSSISFKSMKNNTEDEIHSNNMSIPTMHCAPDTSMVVWRKCTPFCDKMVECPEHHDILQAIVNCTDQLGHLSNLDTLKSTIEKFQNLGWDRNDCIPDPVSSNRLPLIHWAASLGKCNALEWMLSNGFDSNVTTGPNSEHALHRTILYLYKSRPKFTTKELKPKFRKICGLLSDLMIIPDTNNCDTPLHLAANLLCTSETRLVFFQTAIEVMAAHTKEMTTSDRLSVLDSKNNDGNTCLHILATVCEKIKIDHACTAISALLQAGADKTIRNVKDQTPLDIAIQKGCNNIIDELVKIVTPSFVTESPSSTHDSRSLMTMVELRRSSPPISNSMVNLSRTYYGGNSPQRSRSRSPHRSPTHGSRSPRESPPMVHSKYDDMHRNGFHVVKNEEDGDIADSSFQPTSPSSDATSMSHCLDVNSPLLSHLAEAGLLTEVSDLLSRAKARDEGQLKRYQQQAKDLDTQILYKMKEIDRIKNEVDTLHKKRSKCDDQAAHLKRKLASCHNAIRELPSADSSQSSGAVQSSAPSPLVYGNGN